MKLFHLEKSHTCSKCKQLESLKFFLHPKSHFLNFLWIQNVFSVPQTCEKFSCWFFVMQKFLGWPPVKDIPMSNSKKSYFMKFKQIRVSAIFFHLQKVIFYLFLNSKKILATQIHDKYLQQNFVTDFRKTYIFWMTLNRKTIGTSSCKNL